MASILYSNSTDMRVSQVLAAEYQLSLADRASIFGTALGSLIAYAGNMAGKGSTTVQIPLAALNGVNRLAPIAENASTTPTSVTTTSVTASVARQALERSMSDLNALVDSVGYNVPALVADGLGAYAMRLMEMIVALFPSVTNQVGSSGVDMTAANWFTARFTLTQNSVPGPYAAVLYPVQVTDLQNSIRSESGPWQYLSDTQQILAAGGVGVVAILDGIPIFSSSLVNAVAAGADSSGCMFGAGAFGYVDGSPAPIRGGDVQIAAGAPLYTEFERDASASLTKVVHNAHLGTFILENARAVEIATDR